ncbi:MAG TPA: hypothetical protein VFM22_04815 [Castellaniella sp.]|jgi:hypothetical protein|nr:hypothetical protein [Castellaniella sp.]
MNRVAQIVVTAVGLSLLLSGCETTNSIPYKASTPNVIAIQQNLQSHGKTVNVGSISLAPGVDENLMCRMNGPVKVAPGKSLAQYIKEAFQEELFLAQAYKADAPATINGRLDAVSFSSVSPANWKITMQVSSNYSSGYTVSVKYPFETSWTAYSACKNVADAFGPAVQELLKEVVRHPQFSSLAG